jgi:3-oxoadipate enol-lactonase
MSPKRLAPHLHYDVSGPRDAPAIVLSGSIATTLACWDHQAAVLSRTHRVIRYDHRGHGLSAVPDGPYTIADLGGDVIGLLDELNVPAASFCGLSLGGMVGMWVAAHVPERLNRLILSSTTPQVPTTPWEDRMAIVRESGTGALAGPTMERWFTQSFRDSRNVVVSRIADMVRLTPDRGYLACSDAMVGMNLWPDISRISAKTVVIAGSDDQSVPPSTAEKIAHAIRDGGGNASVAVIHGAAHLVNVEQPEIFTSLLVTHLLE